LSIRGDKAILIAHKAEQHATGDLMSRIEALVPPVMRTVFLVDAMYMHAAWASFDRATKEENRIQRADRGIQRLKEREERILARHGGAVFDAYDELEPVYIQMEGADYNLCQAYGPFVQSVALVHILCAASLEAHINSRGKSRLSGKILGAFEHFQLESKWLVLPKLLGLAGFDPGQEPFQSFAVLVRLRNSLVHYRERLEDWEPPGVPSFLSELGLSKAPAAKSLQCVRAMITELARQMSEEEPFWLSHKGGISYFHIAGEPS
jgi:hypothetical protein